jgi:hypothetical protein
LPAYVALAGLMLLPSSTLFSPMKLTEKFSQEV